MGVSGLARRAVLLLLLACAARGDVNVTVLVVGKVSIDSANVLLELAGGNGEVASLCGAAPTEVLRLEDDGGTVYAAGHGVDCSTLASRRPLVFSFDALPAATFLQVKLAPSIVSQHEARLRTHSSTQDNVSLGVVSCNKYSLTVEEIATAEDLWEPLAEMVRAGEMTGVLHVGDQVYIDNDRYQILGGAEPKNGRSLETILAWCPWCRAEALLRDLPSSDWNTHAEDIKESFREIYRKSWGHPPTAYVLANTMNLFVIDDHALVDDIGDEPEDSDPSTMRFFLASLAFEVAWEYQYALMGPWPSPRSQAYHSHKFADSIGLFFLDVRVQRSVLYVAGSPEIEAKLGRQQWSDLTTALAPGGSMSGVSVLVLVSPTPVAYTTQAANDLLTTKIDDFKGAWAAYPDEQNALLSLLQTWQSESPGRKVVIVAGDVHHGGHTAVFNQEGDEPVFEQLTASAIANREFTSTEDFMMTLLQNVFETLQDFRYRHYGWTTQRNFGVLAVQLPAANKSKPFVEQHIYVTDGAGGAMQFSTYTEGQDLENGAKWWVLVIAVASGLCCCACTVGVGSWWYRRCT